jgi:type I restriction-modification system DNA methylase subunit
MPTIHHPKRDDHNDNQYIENLVAYAEAKDNCSVDDNDWKDGIAQGILKSKKLKLPFFIVTNCRTSVFYNSANGKEISLNGNPLREFQTIDIFRLIKHKLSEKPDITDIRTNVDSISTISEAVFNKKLWELAIVYRGINFKNNVEKIDFTIGFVTLEFFEERAKTEGTKDASKIYWTECNDAKAEKVVGNLAKYIQRLEAETSFKEFSNLMELVRVAIVGQSGKNPMVEKDDVKRIYDIIDSMKPLHGAGFDLFGAVYEMFANTNEKRDFGEYFTRRHYTHIFSKLLLKDEKYFNKDREFRLLDPACGTGGFLTEGFKVLTNSYQESGTLSKAAREFLEKDCFYGIDIREENISRTKLNMFLVGDGHTNMWPDNTLTRDFKGELFDFVITNPPYGNGSVKAETSSLSSNRTEIAFICRIIRLLKVGGRACVITPDGILENPSYAPFRKELLDKCDIYAIVSLPKFAFAPYTKEKTYAVFFKKRSEAITKVQSTPIWMYVIDNDGLANSDKRFPTKLRNNRNGWMHDEISGWVSTDGEEMPGLLEERWLTFDDSQQDGTEWTNEKGERVKFRKGGNINPAAIVADPYCFLLPEYYLRPFVPSFITIDQLRKEVLDIENELEGMRH